MDSVFVHPSFHDQFDLEDPEQVSLRDGLIEAFKYWAEYGDHPDFGKDVSYRDPAGSVVPKVGLRHVHLRPVEGAVSTRIWDDQYADPYRKTSNRHLVYVMSDEGDRAMLYYFEADAHAQARDDDYRFLKALGRAAEEWLQDEKLYPYIGD